jgi:hypothetical protein
VTAAGREFLRQVPVPFQAGPEIHPISAPRDVRGRRRGNQRDVFT